jgi:hypothetical protein
MQFGQDVLFTYGPLGWTALFHAYDRDLFIWQLVFQSVYATTCLCLLLSGTRRWPTITRIFFWTAFLLFLTQEQELACMAASMIGFFGIIDSADDKTKPSLPLWLTPLFAAALSVIKATFLFITIASLLIAGIYLLAKKAPGRLARVAGLYGSAFLAIYLLCGQKLRSLPDYMSGVLDISIPYPEGMLLPVYSLIGKDSLAIATQAGLLVLAAIMSIFLLKHSGNRPKTLAKGLLYWLFFILIYKHGLTRHPMEILHWSMLMLPLMAPLAGDPDAPLFAKWRKNVTWQWARQEPSLILGVAVFIPAVMTVSYACGILPTAHYVSKNTYAFVIPRSLAGYEAELVRQRNLHALPSIRAAVGGSRVDAMGQNQHVIFYNDLNYTPRPMFQSYSVYSEKLIRANYVFLKSERAPDYMILDMETIDNRLPLQSDSLAWLDIAGDYEWICNEKNVALWRRQTHGGGHLHLELASRDTARMTEFVSLPSRPVWLSLDIRLSVIGQMVKLPGWSPVFYLDVKKRNGHVVSFRLIRDAARAGFVISPTVMTCDDFKRFAELGEGEAVEAFRVRVSNSSLANPEFAYEISTINKAGWHE